MLDALEHDLEHNPVPTVIATFGEVRNAHREYESMRATAVDVTVDDSDHEVPGPLRGSRFALLNDHHSEDLNEQVGPDLGGVGRRRRLVLRNRRHGEDASTTRQKDPDLDGVDSVEGA